jgi:hypothetical protein
MGALFLHEAWMERASWGHTLTVIYSAETPATKTKQSAAMLPLLVILFIVSYGILTLLVFEQGQTIESQRSLLRETLRDSSQLAALKERLARDDSKRKAALQPDHKDAAADSSVPTTGARTLDKDTKKPSKSAHATKEIPSKPAADLEDVRRSTRVI